MLGTPIARGGPGISLALRASSRAATACCRCQRTRPVLAAPRLIWRRAVGSCSHRRRSSSAFTTATTSGSIGVARWMRSTRAPLSSANTRAVSRHWWSASICSSPAPTALPYVTETLLREEDRLARLRTQAHQRLSEWIPFAMPVSVLRAAAVELVGEPVAPGAHMGTLHPAGAEPAAVDHTAPELRSVRRELGGVKLDVLDLRRRLGPLQEAFGSAGGAAPIEIVHESSAWTARRSSRLTVVMALRGGREPARLALDSLLHSRQRDFELVVVDAGSSERTHRSAGLEGPSASGRAGGSSGAQTGGGRGVHTCRAGLRQ